MKAKQKTKQAGKRKTERAETTRGAQAAQGAANGCAKRTRPVWVDESDAEEITDFDKPSPHLFTSACSFIWDAAETAYRNGDNALLSREGVADALEFIAHGVIIGSGLCDAAGSYDYMLEDWIISQENKKRAAAHYEGLNATAQKLYRLQFWGWFDETKKADKETQEKRQYYLSANASMGELLKGVKRTFHDNPKTADLDCFDKMTDAIIRGYCKTEKPNPAIVRADWLNSQFSMAGESLARWFKIAALPEYNAVAEVREMIADNFGVFPAPFTYTDFGAVELKTDALEKLVFIARATAREAAHSCAARERPEPLPTQSNGTGAMIGARRGDGGKITGVAGKWATAHGVKDYNGESFIFKGHLIERGNTAAQWADIAAIIESEETDGAARLPRDWRGKFSTASEDFKIFLPYVRPVEERKGTGAGWVRLESKPMKKRLFK